MRSRMAAMFSATNMFVVGELGIEHSSQENLIKNGKNRNPHIHKPMYTKKASWPPKLWTHCRAGVSRVDNGLIALGKTFMSFEGDSDDRAEITLFKKPRPSKPITVVSHLSLKYYKPADTKNPAQSWNKP